MPRVRSFPPVAGRGARALILGSMPGAASLAAGRYYAHPRNSFWRIVSDVFSDGKPLPYAARLRLLKKNRLALWDVLGSCVRKGSADSAIRTGSARVNDILSFLGAHPGVRRVWFNGFKAEECFMKRVLPSLGPRSAGLKFGRLPSTSPAHASWPYARKLAAWRKALLSFR